MNITYEGGTTQVDGWIWICLKAVGILQLQVPFMISLSSKPLPPVDLSADLFVPITTESIITTKTLPIN